MTKPHSGHTQTVTRRIPGIVVPVAREQGRLRSSKRNDFEGKAQLAPAFYVGWQEGTMGTEGFSLYTLTKEIPGHSQWSTVSGKTLVDAGFMLPSRETGRERARSHLQALRKTVESTRTAA
jgi:hypothetical protein